MFIDSIIMRIMSFWVSSRLSRPLGDRSFITRGGGGGVWWGYNFLRGLNLRCQFWRCAKCEKGRKICIVDKKKIASLPATKFYPYITLPSNLSAISTTRNVARMYAHTWVKNVKLTNEDATCEKGSRGFRMFGPKLYKLEWQKDRQQTSSHVSLFNTDVSPFGLVQCIYKIKTWIKLQGENKVT